MSAVRNTSVRRGFSLVELLMAIFILGIGVISIAALFPAGIAQQRRAVDDMTGSLVANNAMAILRGRLQQDDFGTFEEYGFVPPRADPDDPSSWLFGDWMWIRPAVLMDGGHVDVFGANVSTDNAVADPIATYALNGGIPFNRFSPFVGITFIDGVPEIIIPQEERFYPQGTGERPQYYWDCMFRRFQGKILVAVFVYRVSALGGEPGMYVRSPNDHLDGLDNAATFVPHWLDLDDAALGNQAWDADGDPSLDYTDGAPMDWQDANRAWQLDGQWMIDQNNNIHRVLMGRRTESDGPVELVRPVPAIISPQVARVFSAGDIGGTNDVVTDIWYVPAFIAGPDENGIPREFRLTPVYVTVKEL